jgi:hypothetical protein
MEYLRKFGKLLSLTTCLYSSSQKPIWRGDLWTYFFLNLDLIGAIRILREC